MSCWPVPAKISFLVRLVTIPCLAVTVTISSLVTREWTQSTAERGAAFYRAVWLQSRLGNDLIFGGVGADIIYGGQTNGPPTPDASGLMVNQLGLEHIADIAGDDVIDGNFGDEAIDGGRAPM